MRSPWSFLRPSKLSRAERRYLKRTGKHIRPRLERLEDRTLLTGNLSINNVTVTAGSVGQTVQGTLNPGNETNAYHFTGYDGQRINFHWVSGAANTGTWSVYGPNSTLVGNNSFGKDLQVTLPSDGSYSVMLAGNQSATENYSFQANDDSDTPVAVSGFGTVHSGTLAANSTASFTYTAPAGRIVYFDSQSNNGTYFNLTGPDGSSELSGYTYYDYGPIALQRSGTHTLTLTNNSGSSRSYAFRLLDLQDGTTTPLTLGQTVTATSSSAYSADVYSFNGAAGQRIFYDGLSDSSSGYMRVGLVGPGGTYLFSNNYSVNDYGALTLPESGTYYLFQSNVGSSTPSYSFRLLDTSAAPALSFGSTTSGTLNGGPNSAGSSTDLYSFTGSAGQRLYLHSISGYTGYYNDYILYGPNNQQVTYQYIGYDFAVTLPTSGTYVLAVQGYSYNTSSLSYSFEALQPATNTSAYTLGTTQSGNIAYGQIDNYTFTGNIGQRLYFDGLEDSGSLNVTLTGPSGANAGINTNVVNDQGPITLTASGTYTLSISSNNGTGNGTGAYSFRLLDVSTATALNFGTTTSGTLNAGPNGAGTSTDLYSFTGKAGQRLYLHGLSGGTSGQYALWGPAGQYINVSSNYGAYLGYDFAATLPEDGTYLLAAQGYSGNSSSVSYSFEALQPATNTNTYTLGATQSGNIAYGQIDDYTFTGSVGQRLYFDGLQGSSGIYASLTSPSGVNAGINNTYLANDAGPITLTESGTYTLNISSYSGTSNGTGAYSFRLLDLSSATPLKFGTTTSGTLSAGPNNAGTSTDLYSFSGSAGQRLYFHALTGTNGSYYLYDPSGRQIASSYIGSDFEATLGVAGAYLLTVQGYSGNSSSVSYSFQALQPATNTSAYKLGSTQNGNIAYGQIDNYTFTGSAGQRLYFDGLQGSSYIYAWLTGPSGVNAGINNTYLANDAGPITLTESGTYTLNISSYSGTSNGTGAYSFRLLDLSTATPLSFGTTTSGTLNAGPNGTGTSTDLYSFTGTAGQRLYFHGITGSSGSFTLYGPANQNVSSSYLGGDFTATLGEAGTYLLAVQGYSGNTTPVSYSFQALQPATNTTPYTLGTTASGNIAYGQIDNYTFTGSVGQRLYFDGLVGSNGLYATLSQFNGAINNISLANDAGPVTLTAAGTYTLSVSSNNGTSNGFGSYSFRLLDAAAAAPLDLTNLNSGTIDPGTGTVLYTLNGTAGQRIKINWASGTGGSYYLYGANNQYINNAGFGANLQFVLPASGLYILALRGGASSPITYSFQAVDDSDAPVAVSGFGTFHSGTLAGNSSTTFTYTAPAGRTVYFDSKSGNTSLSFTLTAPDGSMVMSGNAGYGYGPVVLPRSGTYTLTLNNGYSSSRPYDFRLLDLQSGTTTALTLGQTVTATSSNPYGADVYSFTGSVGQQLYYDGLSDSSSGMSVKLIGPSGESVFSTNTEFDNVPVTLTESGTYYLFQINNGPNTPSYSFRLLDLATAKNLSFGTTTSGTLDGAPNEAGTSTDLYSFTGSAGQRLYLHSISGYAGYGNYYVLYGPNNQQVTEDYIGYDFAVTLPTAGNYLLAVQGYSYNSSSVSYSFEALQPATNSSAYTLGTTQSGNIAYGQIDNYTFTGSAGQRLYFDGLQGSSYIYAWLTSPSGVNAGINNTYLANDAGPITLTESGTYTLNISSYSGTSNGTGAYSFRLSDISTATPLSFGTTTSGTLNAGPNGAGTSTDLYSFTGKAGQRIYLHGLSGGTSGNYALWGPAGQFVYLTGASYYYYTYLGYDSSTTLPEDGTYLLAAQGYSGNSSSVAYSFEALQPATNTNTYTLGATQSGNIAYGQIDNYTFTGSAGQRLYFDGLQGSSNFYVTLTSPSGATSNFNYVGYDAGPITLTESGAYTLSISSNNGTGNSTGAYSFRLLDLTSATALNFGTTTSGTLNAGPSSAGTSTDLYSFSGSAGQRLYFHAVTGTSGTYYLYDPSGRQITSSYIGSDFEATLGEAGTYLLTVQGSSSNSSSVSYSFEALLPATNTNTYTLGSTQSGNIAYGQIDYYTFTGSIGQRLFYDGLQGSQNLFATLTSPSGVVTGINDFVGYDQGPITLTESGTYTLSISSGGGYYYGINSTGSYSFRLLDLSSATPLSFGTTTSGTLNAGPNGVGTSTNLYSFTGSKYERLYFHALSGSNASYYVYGPTGQQVAGNYIGYDFAVTLPTDGTYLLAVQGSSSNNSSVSYSFQALQPATNTIAYTLGNTQSGNIAYGQIDDYTFTGTVGQRLYFNGLSGASSLNAELFSPSLANGINTYSFYDAGPITLTESGTYFLRISSNNGGGSSTGAYSFRLLDLGAQPDILTGAVFTVTLSQANSSPVSVQYATQDNTAIAGTDYVARSGSLVFDPGQTSQSIEVFVLPDPQAASSVQFYVNLSNPSGATIANGQGIGTIINPNPVATSLSFVQQPTDITADQTLGPVQVEVLDQFGNLMKTSNAAILLALATNPAGGTLGGTLTENAVNGIATFSDLTLRRAGNGYSLAASSSKLTGATSTTFSVSPAAASLLAFGQQPADTKTGQDISPPVTVLIEDAYNNLISTATNSVTMALGTNPSGGTLNGTLTQKAVNGVATFGDLSINQSGIGYTLTASSSNLTSATSNPFTEKTVAAAVKFKQEPTDVAAGLTIRPAITVQVVDSSGNIVTNSSDPVTLALASNPGGATLGGTLTEHAVNGIATFSDITLNQTGTYMLTASSGSLTGDTSTSFNVTAAVPSTLQFVQQPAGGTADVAPGVVTVEVLDSLGNKATSSDASITLSLNSTTSGAQLGGTLTVQASNGLATFSDLALTTAGTGYTLTAQSDGLTAATSQVFDVTPAAASAVQFAQQPSDVDVSQTMSPAPAVAVVDKYGNVVDTNAAVTIALGANPGGGTLGGTLTENAVHGIASFGDLTLKKEGIGYTLVATSGSFTVTSNGFNVNPAPASLVQFVQQPTSGNVGAAINPAITVQVMDAYGDVVDTSASVTLAIGTNPGGAALSGTLTVNAVHGIATFDDISLNVPSNGYTLVASSGNLTTDTSASFNETLVPAPDLVPTDVALTPSAGLQSGGSLTVSWDDTNNGNLATASGWYDKVVLVNTTTGQTLKAANLYYDPTLPGTGPIAPGQSQARSVTFTLPDGPDGVGTITATISLDATQVIPEANAQGTGRSNDIVSISENSTLAPYPDLQVANLAVTPSTGLQSGAALTVSWNDNNTGTGSVSGKFYDHLVVTNLTTGQTIATQDLLYDPTVMGNGAIAAGDTRARQISLTLPRGTPGAGNLQFTVTTDYYNQVFEYNTSGTAESNNTTSITQTSALEHFANLVPSAVTAPTSAIGDPSSITVGWTVTNNGTGPTDASSWTDAVILSTTDDPNAGQVLASFTHQGALAVGGSYTNSQDILIPPQFQGNRYHLFVQSDANGTVFENGATNFAEAPSTIDISSKPYADLIVPTVTASPTGASGQSIQVTWTVKNQGIGVTDLDQWSDSIALATDAAGTNLVEGVGTGVTHIGVLAPGGSYTSTADLPLPISLTGTYYVVVTTGGPYEFIFTNNNTGVTGPVTVTLTPPPDLTVTTVSGPSSATGGDTVDVSWNVKNVGPGDANPSWKDEVDLVQIVPAGVTPETIDLGDFEYDKPLQSGTTYSPTNEVTIPKDIEGLWQFAVTANADNGLFENGATSNNTYVDPNPITISQNPNPDLQVFSVTAPSTGQAGGNIGVTFTIINQGPVSTGNAHWVDDVYLSYDNKLSSDDILLGSFNNQTALDHGQSYRTQTGDLLIPKRFGGSAYIIVDTNAGGSVDEAPNDDNNTYAVPINVTPLPPSDLVMHDVAAPDQTFDGTTITVQYTVSNKGVAVTDVPDWTDTIWLAHDPKRPNVTKGDVLLATIPHSGILGYDTSVLTPPTSYTVSTTVTIPKHISGQFYITPWTDSFDEVIKSTFDPNINPDDPNELNNDNWKGRPITVLLTPPPDLVVTNVTPQQTATGGDPFNVQWTVQNQGTNPTEDSVLFDNVFLSNKPNPYDPTAQTWFLGKIEHDGVVAAGHSYTVQHTFQLTPEASGTYVIVVTNAGDIPRIFPTWEGPYTNDNTLAAATNVVPRALGDLRVTSIVTQPVNYSGEQTTIQWTVTNFGATMWPGTRYWYDEVYVSPYPSMDWGKLIDLGRFYYSNTGPLGTGQSYTQTTTFTLPRGIGGTAVKPQNYYVYIETDPFGSTGGVGGSSIYPDASSAVSAMSNDNSYGYFTGNGYEDPSNNWNSASIPVIYREPDLVVSSAVVPTTQLHSGQTFSVSWTVTNTGNRDTREGYWIDRVFLARNNNLTINDIELGEVGHYSILKAGDSYTVTLNVTMPQNSSGNFYLIFFTDATVRGNIGWPGLGEDLGTYTPLELTLNPEMATMGRVPEFQGEGNNETAVPINSVGLTPPPDLQVTAVTAVGPNPNQPDHVKSNELLTVNYTVTNAGQGDTPSDQSSWKDLIYLSRDPIIDSSDFLLGSYQHTGGLAAGESYQNTLTFKAPRKLSGPWYVGVVTDPSGGQNYYGSVFEGGGNNENNNDRPTAKPIIIDLQPPADLEIESITVPATAQAGQPISISWTGKNIGLNAAPGSWTDAAYLSTGPNWDISDPILGTVTVSGTGHQGDYEDQLYPGEEYTATLNAVLPAVVAGQYRIIVRTNIFEDVVESNTDNNTTASANVVNVTVPELHLGVSLATTLSTGQTQLYAINIGLGQALRVDLTSSDPTADNEIYLRYNAVPTDTTYDAIYQGPLQANQYAVIPTTQAGTYYLLVRGQMEPADNTPITLLAQALPFEITDVTPDSGGDSRYVTTDIYGAQFNSQAIVKLVRPGIAEYEPVSYQVVDATKIIAVFDLRNAPHGLYDVEVINPDGSTAFAPYRYLVEPALPPDLSIAVGGDRVLYAGTTGHYGFTLNSLTNVDMPYVNFQFGVPEIDGLTPPYPHISGYDENGNPIYAYRHLAVITNVQGTPQVSNVPWGQVNPQTNTTGEDLVSGTAMDFPDQTNTTLSFAVQTYPDGVPPDAPFIPPTQTAFSFHIVGAATPQTPAEYVAQQTQIAATLRASILADKTASTSLQILAADPTTWTNLYLASLTQAGLLRPVDVPPAAIDTPQVTSLVSTLAAGILAGPAGNQVITNGNLVQFFDQVRQWYGNDPTKQSPYLTTGYDYHDDIDSGITYIDAAPPPSSDYNLNEARPTHFEAFNVYVWYQNDWDAPPPDDIDQAHPENPNFVPVPAPNFTPFLAPQGTQGQVNLSGPTGFGNASYIPVGQSLPYTINFANPSNASGDIHQVRIVERLDPSIDPRSFRLGDLQIGDLQVHIPNTVGSFQGDFDFTQSKGFILRVSAGIDLSSNTVTWLLQAIDPSTGQLMQDPSKGLLPPDNAQGAGEGFVTYTVQPQAGLNRRVTKWL